MSIFEYFQPFSGNFKGKQYSSERPPSEQFKNNLSCKPLADFARRTLIDRLQTGAISLVGRVGGVNPTHLVLPLTVEPDGFLFNHVWGKTLRDRDKPAIKNLPRSRNKTISENRLYKGVSFWPQHSAGGVFDAPFNPTTAEARLKVYLKKMTTDNGETLHGFRARCAITLALLGAGLSEIMVHVGWTRRHTALYYLQLAKVLNLAGASARLSTVDVPSVSSEWQDINNLKGFICAFPSDSPAKRSLFE